MDMARSTTLCPVSCMTYYCSKHTCIAVKEGPSAILDRPHQLQKGTGQQPQQLQSLRKSRQ